MSLDRLVDVLAAYEPTDAERTHRERIRHFIETTPHPTHRSTPEGHLTGSAVVLSPDGRALLLHHARLGLWVQPGGHMDPTETNPADTALREATEESNLSDLVLDRNALGASLLDVDIHPIPASPSRQEPAHFHYDLCYLARTRTPELTRIDVLESRAFRWVSFAEMPNLTLDTATRRRLLKAFAIAV